MQRASSTSTVASLMIGVGTTAGKKDNLSSPAMASGMSALALAGGRRSAAAAGRRVPGDMVGKVCGRVRSEQRLSWRLRRAGRVHEQARVWRQAEEESNRDENRTTNFVRTWIRTCTHPIGPDRFLCGLLRLN